MDGVRPVRRSISFGSTISTGKGRAPTSAVRAGPARCGSPAACGCAAADCRSPRAPCAGRRAARARLRPERSPPCGRDAGGAGGHSGCPWALGDFFWLMAPYIPCRSGRATTIAPIAVDTPGPARHKAHRDGQPAPAGRPREARTCSGDGFGGVSEWLKETDCKSVGYAYAGSNPAPSTTTGPEAASPGGHVPRAFF
jgi:hypothetical protein